MSTHVRSSVYFLQATKNDTGQQREKTEEERNKFEKGEHDLGPVHHVHLQGSHRPEKYSNIQDCLEKSLKIKFVMKSTWNTLKGLEKSLNFTINRRIQQCLWRPQSV